MAINNGICVDSLGNPQPAATISQIVIPARTITDNTGTRQMPMEIRTTLSSTALGQESFDDIDDALAWAENQGYVISETKRDGYGRPLITLTHTATAQYLVAQEAMDVERWADAQPCFIRFGRLPKSGQSRNSRDSIMEQGVSVFRGLRLDGGLGRVQLSHQYEMGTFLMLQDRQAYFVDGDEIGVGSDGEPVLANVRVICPVSAIG